MCDPTPASRPRWSGATTTTGAPRAFQAPGSEAGGSVGPVRTVAGSPCGRSAAAYAPAMALPILLAVGLLGYAGYRVAKMAVASAERDRRRDWFAVQDHEAVAAGKDEVVHGGGAGLLDRRAWLKGNALSTSYEFQDGAVRFKHQGDARRYAERFGLAAPVMSAPVAPTP
jgi:hypothetical protein